MECEHKNATYIKIINCPNHEIYMCDDCGVLIDTYNETEERVTPKEFIVIMSDFVDCITEDIVKLARMIARR